MNFAPSPRRGEGGGEGATADNVPSKSHPHLGPLPEGEEEYFHTALPEFGLEPRYVNGVRQGLFRPPTFSNAGITRSENISIDRSTSR